jgi:hypothetical protein
MCGRTQRDFIKLSRDPCTYKWIKVYPDVLQIFKPIGLAQSVQTHYFKAEFVLRSLVLLKFTSPALELLQCADTEKPFLGENYDGIDIMVEKTMEIISQESPWHLFVDAHFVIQ